MSGWVPINRSDWDGDVLVRGEMSEVEAWHWLQASAAYEDTTQNVRGKIVPVPKGAVMVTLRRLATEFRWGSDKRVRTFLRKLEKAGWITFGADAAADAAAPRSESSESTASQSRNGIRGARAHANMETL